MVWGFTDHHGIRHCGINRCTVAVEQVVDILFTVKRDGKSLTNLGVGEVFVFQVAHQKFRSTVGNNFGACDTGFFNHLHPVRVGGAGNVDFTAQESLNCGCVFLNDSGVNLIQLYILCIPVVWIFYKNHFGVLAPAFYHKRAAANNLVCGRTVFFAPLFIFILSYRIQAAEQFEEVGCRMNQFDFQSFIIDCFYCDFVRSFAVIVQRFAEVFDNAVKQPCIGGSGFRICHQFEGVFKIFCCQRLTVAPFCIFTHMEGVGQTVFADIPAFRCAGNRFGGVAGSCVDPYQSVADSVVRLVIGSGGVQNWV